MSDISQFLNPQTQKLSTVMVAEWIASDLGRGHDGTYYEYVDGIYEPTPELTRRRVAQALGDRYSATVLGQVEAHLLNVTIPRVGPPSIPGKGYMDYIVLRNGVYYWETDELLPHNPLLGALNRLQFGYDPSATAPKFSEWLSIAFAEDEDTIRHVWEMIGYLLMTGNPDQIAFLFHGEGGNGKGTLMRVIEQMIGEDNIAALTLQQISEGKFELSTLYGKMINLAGDISSKYIENPEVFKSITGDDYVTAQHKFGAPFKFKSYAVPVFSLNNYFRVGDASEGWKRRWIALDFNVPMRGRIAGFDEQELYAESPGIFNEAMRALRRLMGRPRNPVRFDPPNAVKEATRRMHEDADPLMRWLNEDDGVYLGELHSDRTDLVYQSYVRWCRRNGYTSGSSGAFGQRLLQVDGIMKRRVREGASRAYVYEGIGVRRSQDEEL